MQSLSHPCSAHLGGREAGPGRDSPKRCGDDVGGGVWAAWSTCFSKAMEKLQAEARSEQEAIPRILLPSHHRRHRNQTALHSLGTSEQRQNAREPLRKKRLRQSMTNFLNMADFRVNYRAARVASNVCRKVISLMSSPGWSKSTDDRELLRHPRRHDVRYRHVRLVSCRVASSLDLWDPCLALSCLVFPGLPMSRSVPMRRTRGFPISSKRR